MPDGLCITMPLGVFNCASTKSLQNDEVEFPLLYPIFFSHTSVPLILLYAQILVKYPVNLNIYESRDSSEVFISPCLS